LVDWSEGPELKAVLDLLTDGLMNEELLVLLLSLDGWNCELCLGDEGKDCG
jgi:hypothetical protein